MLFIKLSGKRLLLFFAVCFTVMFFSYLGTLSAVPGKLVLLEGQEYTCNFRSPFFVNIQADKSDIVQLNSSEVQTSGKMIRFRENLQLKSRKSGSVNLKMRLLGLIPLKTMKVEVVSDKKVVACGNTVGVKLRINGILVIGVSEVETYEGKKLLPTKATGIKPGDRIIEVNKVKLESIEELVSLIDNSKGEKLSMVYIHENHYIEASVTPVRALDDKRYHIGLWVRDSTAGIGTLTFYDPQTGFFGALGHGITDIDTGIIMPVFSGEILESNILAIRKGQQGNPGELKGVFIEDGKLGDINKNSEYGIYGVMSDSAKKRIGDRQYPIALRDQVKEGQATIFANIEGKTVEEYSIEIQKISRQNSSNSKGMIIKVTDSRLLNSTGGIVQGMSGSPILQNGRIVGAVTHVLVNDPTRGYGIFIEWMLQSNGNSNISHKGMAA